MKYELKDLGYNYDALEPVLDTETMKIHHDKHHQTYVNNFNKAIGGLSLKYEKLDDILKHPEYLSEASKTAILNHGGGHYNHSLFWESMQPGGSSAPSGVLLELIKQSFGSFENMKQHFDEVGANHFGSGWVWLVYSNNKLKIYSLPNQDSPLSIGDVPLLGNDLWEHAYYLKYQNKRPDYLKEWWSVVNWDVVSQRLEKAKS